MKKHPYIYSVLIGWPILWYILVLIDDNSKVYVEVLLIILFSFPIIIFFLWFRKNKSKIKPFYKRNTFEKHPYLYTFVIGWPILFYIINEFTDPLLSYRYDGYVYDYVLVIIFLSFPVIIFFLL